MLKILLLSLNETKCMAWNPLYSLYNSTADHLLDTSWTCAQLPLMENVMRHNDGTWRGPEHMSRVEWWEFLLLAHRAVRPLHSPAQSCTKHKDCIPLHSNCTHSLQKNEERICMYFTFSRSLRSQRTMTAFFPPIEVIYFKLHLDLCIKE